MDAARNEGERLETALKANRPLMAAYYQKEELHRICGSSVEAEENEGGPPARNGRLVYRL